MRRVTKKIARRIGRFVRHGILDGEKGISELMRQELKIKRSTLIDNNFISVGDLWRKIRPNEVLFYMAEPVCYIMCDRNYKVRIA